jgi:predicted DNA-binding ribbon-helix-helix protein
MSTERPTRPSMKSASMRRDVRFDGHKTSVNLEDAFWDGFQLIAKKQGMTVSSLVATINSNRTSNNLSSEIRLFVLEHYRRKVDGADQS